jgi:uncharacterized protein YrrD
MKRKLQIMTSVSAASLLAFSALAQETVNSKSDETATTGQRMAGVRAEQLNGAAKATDIIGMTVNNYQNETIGKVNDLAVDVASGRIVVVILSSGGFFGMDRTLTAVPPCALRDDPTHKVLQLDVSKEKFAAAPKFDNSKWDENTQSNQVTQVYGYYGVQPWFVAGRDGYGNPDRDGIFAATLPRNMDGTINQEGPRTMDRVHNVEIVSNLEATNNWFSTRNPDGTWTREYYSNNARPDHSWSQLDYVEQAGKLIGTPVKNLQDQDLGKVDNFMVDLSAGRIVAVIISTGGFLDMANELSAVPPTALRFNVERETLQLDASRERLAGSPHFQADAWPDFGQPSYAGGVYQAYNIEPYFITDTTTSADNTRQIGRNEDNQTASPLEQGSSQADRDITAQIHTEINADKDMSVNARNVQVATIDGRVTLRGSVNTAGEKRLIGEIANRIAHDGNVDNQIEVPINTTSRD